MFKYFLEYGHLSNAFNATLVTLNPNIIEATLLKERLDISVKCISFFFNICYCMKSEQINRCSHIMGVQMKSSICWKSTVYPNFQHRTSYIFCWIAIHFSEKDSFVWHCKDWSSKLQLEIIYLNNQNFLINMVFFC